MSDSSHTEGPLYRLYAKYVGEPESRTAIYGYWLFILGYLCAAVGLATYLYMTAQGIVQQFLIREVAFSIAAAGLPIALLGIVLMLPVRRSGLLTAILGLAIAFGGIAWFSINYPQAWGANVISTWIITVYGVGVGIVAGVAAMIPVITGERSVIGETATEVEAAADQSEVLLGERLRGALFAVFNTGEEWAWRFIEEEATADSADRFLTRLETENRVATVKEQIGDAGMLEIRGAAFRLYETDEERWRWVLMREDGGVVADGGDDFETREAAEQSVNLLKEYGPEAEPLTVEGAAFDYFREDGKWRWQLLDESRTGMADSPTEYGEKDEAVSTASTMQAAVDDADVLAIDRYGVELYQPEAASSEDDEEESPWQWRLLDADDFTIAAGEGAYESRNAVETAAYDILDNLGDAPILEAGDPVYEVVPRGPNGWGWRLVDAGTDTVAREHERFDLQGDAERSAKTMKANADAADIFVIDGTSFEVFTDGEQWRWRLVDEDRNVIAIGDDQFLTSEDANEAVETVRAQVPEAELIEFDTAAFQIYEAGERPTGPDSEPQAEWRWRLIDEDGNVLADSGEDYGSYGQALDSMTTLKQYAPDAELLEIENAAFELYDDEEGVWYWRLIDETGDLIARSGEGHPSRQSARLAMDRLIDAAPDTEGRAMGNAGFQVVEEGDSWAWWFVMPDGRVIAESEDDFTTRDQAVATIQDIRSDASAAAVTAIEDLAISVSESNGTWLWRLVDADREPLARGDRRYQERDRLDQELNAIRSSADEIIVFDIEGYFFRIRRAEGSWVWQLLAEDRLVIARSSDAFESEDAVRAAIDRVRRLAPDAGSIDFEPAAFELFQDDDGWRWRLIDEDEHVIATATRVHESRDAAIDELEVIKAAVGDASVLEIDTVAFELHESDDGWRWRLVDGNGDVIGKSINAYSDRGEAREDMGSIKEYAPTARTAVAEYE